MAVFSNLSRPAAVINQHEDIGVNIPGVLIAFVVFFHFVSRITSAEGV